MINRIQVPDHLISRAPGFLLARLGVCLLGGLLSMQCSAYQLKGQPGKPVILEAAGQNCRVVKQKGLYSLLFGAIPLNPVDPAEMFTAGDVSYRVTDEVTTVDTVISILAGWALSLNRRTITIEACDENVRVADPESERKEIDRILEQYARDSRSPVVVLKDGKSHQGRILEFTETEVVLEQKPENTPATADATDGSDESGESAATDSSADASSETPEGDSITTYVDVIELKSGRSIRGKITSQSRQRLVVQVGSRSEEIAKADVKRVRYRVPESEAGPEITVLRIPRANIQKIIVR
jgi:hypothetical protein